MMMKGRKPELHWGVAQVAVVGPPLTIGPDEHVKVGTERIMDAIITCVARAREIYPQRPDAGDEPWWWRDPQTASSHRRIA